MKKILTLVAIIAFYNASFTQTTAFRFVLLTDTHIGSPNGSAEEDLRRTVRDINNQRNEIAFVIVSGDITELGKKSELLLAKKLLDSLQIPYYIIPGNHDTGWSESGGQDFIDIFGSDKFVFEFGGIQFMGCASGPYVRMSDGHIPRDAIVWMDSIFQKTPADKPLIFINHYPLDPSLDNWYEATNRLLNRNTWLTLCGHGHANKQFQADGIPSIMGRSNLRAKTNSAGYTIIDVAQNQISISERQSMTEITKPWAKVGLKNESRPTPNLLPRPSYELNNQFKQVRASWTFASDANIIASPHISGKQVFVGNMVGEIFALSAKTGKPIWTKRISAGIFSSAVSNESLVFVPCATGELYALDKKKGKTQWIFQAEQSILGTPLVHNNIIYFGASDGYMYALEAASGKLEWKTKLFSGPVVSAPVYHNGFLLIGAWDTKLYCVDARTGSQKWSWNNGSAVANFSPASCTPIVLNNTVFIVAPDRYATAIDFTSGITLWRTNKATVRESIGVSTDKQWIYAKTMNDVIVKFSAARSTPDSIYRIDCKYGYDHVPSMLIAANDLMLTGTKNGVIYAVSQNDNTMKWAYKIDNSMVHTVQVSNKKTLFASTMDGKVVRLNW